MFVVCFSLFLQPKKKSKNSFILYSFYSIFINLLNFTFTQCPHSQRNKWILWSLCNKRRCASVRIRKEEEGEEEEVEEEEEDWEEVSRAWAYVCVCVWWAVTDSTRKRVYMANKQKKHPLKRSLEGRHCFMRETQNRHSCCLRGAFVGNGACMAECAYINQT